MQETSAKTLLSAYNECGWFGSNYNMNIYRGCCHGCIYCDSRSECYGVQNFDTVRKKKNALTIIERELKSKRKTGMVITGSMSDPYNPFESDERLTRSALQLIAKYGYGCCIDTKSNLVVRDTDVLQKIKEYAPAVVNFTVTTSDDTMCKKLERNVCETSRRFAAIKELTDSGITACGVLLMPILPFINDTEENITAIVENAAASGAKWVYSGARQNGFGVTLRQNQREYYYMWLERLFPQLKEKYEKTFGESYNCVSPNTQKLLRCFETQCNKYGLLYKMTDIVSFIRKDYEIKQLSLF